MRTPNIAFIAAIALALPTVVWARLDGPSIPKDCLAYEPAAAEITGVVELRTFFGPPGYGEDTAHDAKETQAWLHLSHPICTLLGMDDGDEPESDQNFVTLVPLVQGIKFSTLVGKRISVRGTLYHANTMHHHTPLLMQIWRLSDIKVL